ncbi:CLUMA_CG013584, isoform A [Clunio marinus]|uniref:CLUMA_CG013584, isoform A n=1 Tax=Clunio marinus TaxID=568069 RepID=A0A1J1IJ90_9DIPT|nr:CLUMA_CG013584, isoform A [Clunio marinus]
MNTRMLYIFPSHSCVSEQQRKNIPLCLENSKAKNKNDCLKRLVEAGIKLCETNFEPSSFPFDNYYLFFTLYFPDCVDVILVVVFWNKK